MDAINLLRHWITTSWNFINGIKVPGFEFTYGNIVTALILINGSFTVVHMITGMSMRGGLHGGNNKHIKINDSRKGDVK